MVECTDTDSNGAGAQGNGLLAERISRRTMGKLAGVAAVGIATASVAESAAAAPYGSRPLTRAQFVAMISDHFDWVHSSKCIDPYKNPQPTFRDVVLGRTPYAKQIETALEEGCSTGRAVTSTRDAT